MGKRCLASFILGLCLVTGWPAPARAGEEGLSLGSVSVPLSSFWGAGKKEGDWLRSKAKGEDALLEVSLREGEELSSANLLSLLGEDLDRVIDPRESSVMEGAFSGTLLRCSYTQGKKRGHCEVFAFDAPGEQGLFLIRLLTESGSARDSVNRYYEVLSHLSAREVSPTPMPPLPLDLPSIWQMLPGPVAEVKEEETEETTQEATTKAEGGKKKKKDQKKEEKEEDEEDVLVLGAEEDVLVIGPGEPEGREVLLLGRGQGVSPSPTPVYTPTPKPDRSAAFASMDYEKVLEEGADLRGKKVQVQGRVREPQAGLLGLYDTLWVEDAEGNLWFVTYTYGAGEMAAGEGDEVLVLGTLEGTEKTVRLEGSRVSLPKVRAVDLVRLEKEEEAEEKSEKETEEKSEKEGEAFFIQAAEGERALALYEELLADPDSHVGESFTVVGTVEEKRGVFLSFSEELLLRDEAGGLWSCVGSFAEKKGEVAMVTGVFTGCTPLSEGLAPQLAAEKEEEAK